MDQQTKNLSNHWMPFTANRSFKEHPRTIESAEGLYYYTPDGRKIIDASSGLFTCALGHNRPEIIKAIQNQAAKLDYCPHFNTAAEGLSFEMSNKLAALTPEGMDRMFFTNSGSESVDTAMKIALAYFNSTGQTSRQMFISREKAYHGVNWGGTSLSGMVNNRRIFGRGLAGVAHMRHTLLPENKYQVGLPEHGGENLASDLQRMVDLHGAENIAACIVEPIAGSAGVIIPPKGYLEKLREICTNNGILLIFDEVITGFGRTGDPFAAQTFGVTPDIITMAKALTNGAVPMGAVAVKNEVYDNIINSVNNKSINEFFHGYTYSAHPLACAAGIATLDVYNDTDLFKSSQPIAEYFQQEFYALAKEKSIVTDYRGIGMLAGLDLAPADAPGVRGTDFYQKLFEEGLHVKCTVDVAIFAPPLVSEKAHIDEMLEKIKARLDKY